MEDFLKKLNLLLDKIFNFIIGLLVLGIILLFTGVIISFVIELFGYIAFHLNYIIIIVVVVFLSLFYFEFDLKNRKVKGRKVEDYKDLKARNIFSIIGFAVIGVAVYFGDFFRIYNDGNYCAEVDVYGTSSGFYTLSVEVEDGNVNVIHWKNGGWLDETHFDIYDAQVDSDGMAFFTDDRGREFAVKLIKRGNCQ